MTRSLFHLGRCICRHDAAEIAMNTEVSGGSTEWGDLWRVMRKWKSLREKRYWRGNTLTDKVEANPRILR